MILAAAKRWVSRLRGRKTRVYLLRLTERLNTSFGCCFQNALVRHFGRQAFAPYRLPAHELQIDAAGSDSHWLQRVSKFFFSM